MSHLANNIKALREFSKLSQVEFGKLVGGNQKLISAYENDRVKMSENKILFDLSERFKIPFEVLINKPIVVQDGALSYEGQKDPFNNVKKRIASLIKRMESDRAYYNETLTKIMGELNNMEAK